MHDRLMVGLPAVRAAGEHLLQPLLDWASRRVLAWRLSNTMDTEFCLEALTEALAQHGTPEIFNTDQGSQFTSTTFTAALGDAGIRCSMDGRGRCLDNAFIERLWRSLKYEAVYTCTSWPTASRRSGSLTTGWSTTTKCARTRRWPAARRAKRIETVERNSKRRWHSGHGQQVAPAGCEGIRGRCGARAVEYIHIIHRLVHLLPRTPTPFYRRLFLTREG